jgi:hypothetical protein
MDQRKTLWTCPECGAQFIQKNLYHSCIRLTEEDFLKNKSARSVELYRYFLNEYKKIGPVSLHVVKTRIAFMVLVRFSGVDKFGKDFIEGGFWFKEKIESKKFHRIEFIPKSDFIHRFRITDENDIDDEFRIYMKKAYETGQRKHLKKPIS